MDKSTEVTKVKHNNGETTTGVGMATDVVMVRTVTSVGVEHTALLHPDFEMAKRRNCHGTLLTFGTHIFIEVAVVTERGVDASKAPFGDTVIFVPTKDTYGLTLNVATTFLGGALADNAKDRTKVGVPVRGVGLLSTVGVKIGDHDKTIEIGKSPA